MLSRPSATVSGQGPTQILDRLLHYAAVISKSFKLMSQMFRIKKAFVFPLQDLETVDLFAICKVMNRKYSMSHSVSSDKRNAVRIFVKPLGMVVPNGFDMSREMVLVT